MIDNLHATESGQIDNHPVWNQAASFAAWEMYLGGELGDAASCHAAAARADDLSHLTPAHICVGTEDLFYDEDVDYARRLNAAGVPCELAVFPGLVSRRGCVSSAGGGQSAAHGQCEACAGAGAGRGGQLTLRESSG